MIVGTHKTEAYRRLQDLRIIAKEYRHEIKLINNGERRLYSASAYKKKLKEVWEEIRIISTGLNFEKGDINATSD